ncbi:MAG: hypothetical protein HYY77_19550 [Betaproteobacteria bacterium]|nr:hypothetical protein [Betaproteobacteria bacterium]
MPPAADKTSFKGPPGTCDCHMHVFGDPVRYPYSAARRNSPPADALEKFLDDYLSLARSLGIERMVFVQPSTYGRDNACMGTPRSPNWPACIRRACAAFGSMRGRRTAPRIRR